MTIGEEGMLCVGVFVLSFFVVSILPLEMSNVSCQETGKFAKRKKKTLS
jgi:hypothetical protein